MFIPAEDDNENFEKPEDSAVRARKIRENLTKRNKPKIFKKGGSLSKSSNNITGVSELTNLIGISPRSENMKIILRPIVPNIAFL
jgi:hypothetical protein